MRLNIQKNTSIRELVRRSLTFRALQTRHPGSEIQFKSNTLPNKETKNPGKSPYRTVLAASSRVHPSGISRRSREKRLHILEFGQKVVLYGAEDVGGPEMEEEKARKTILGWGGGWKRE